MERPLYFVLTPHPANLTPDAALLLLTVGLGLLYLELNRPGRILPGAAGLLATLFAIASLLQDPLRPAGLALLGSAIALLAIQLRRHTPTAVPVAATLALILGFAQLVPGGIHLATAILCGLLLGVSTSVLAYIARRARLNKGLD